MAEFTCHYWATWRKIGRLVSEATLNKRGPDGMYSVGGQILIGPTL